MLEVHIAILVIATCFSASNCKLYYEKNPKVSKETFLVPNVPTNLEDSMYGSSRFAIVWSNRVHERNLTGPYLNDYDPDRPEPAVIVIPTELHMIELMPLDSPNPLYSSRFTSLTDAFLLDSMSTRPVDPSDSTLSTPEGCVVKTMTGRELLFKKDPNTDVLTINGLTVEKVERIVGEELVTIYEIDGVLFGYRLRIMKALQILQQTPSEV